MPSPFPKRYAFTLAAANTERLIISNRALPQACTELALQSIEPQNILSGMLPGVLHHYSFRFNQDSASMSFLLQADFRGGESFYHGVLQSAAALTGQIGTGLFKCVRGIAMQVDKLAELLSKVRVKTIRYHVVHVFY